MLYAIAMGQIIKEHSPREQVIREKYVKTHMQRSLLTAIPTKRRTFQPSIKQISRKGYSYIAGHPLAEIYECLYTLTV